MSVRIRGEVFNRLSQAATLNDRPLGSEVEWRLEQSFEQRALSERVAHMEMQLAEVLRLLNGGAMSPNEWRRQMGIPILQ